MIKRLIWFLVFIVVCLIKGQFSLSTDSANSLELVHVIFRHGDRTPEKEVLYPKDPHTNVSYYPIGHGQLTNAGKRKQYLLGKYLHKRYKKFLGTYNIETVDARSTDYNRTKMSLQLVLASLFPPENELVWEKGLKWQPIPFNYWPLGEDHVLGDPYKNCPRYKKLYHDFLSSKEGRKLYDNYTEISNYLREHAGINPTSKELTEIYFTLTAEFENGLKLPNWTRKIYPDIALELANLDYEVSTATPELRRLSSGFLLGKIISDTTQKIEKKLPPNRKMFLYSGHEYNLAYLLRLWGIYYPHVPPYGGYIIIEIHNVNGIRGVKLGKQSSFKLGQLLRRRYSSFLGDIYTPEILEAVSTDFDRTKMTALLVLAGLFPPSESQRWEDSIGWQPVPYHYDKDRSDFRLRRPTHYCPTYVKELEAVLASAPAQRDVKANEKLFEYIEENTKKPIRTLSDVFSVYQILNAQEIMNLTLPEWAKSVYPDQIHAIAAKQCEYENYNAVLKRLNGGRMLERVLKHMVNKSFNDLSPAGRKIFLYSGHENNVINILAALNLFRPHVPKYTAAVIIELHYIADRNDHAVKVLYLRDVNAEPEVQTLEGCDALCPLSNFVQITHLHVARHYTAECGSNVNLD
ncbi:His Phos 2 domain containing protein [Asbolus verrucosus]|uniref:acid phosphatase n=1 Tax=Asbolus verrucosus TaxID=1661398 RepID=A0A482VRI9_ASBVE|nr:His Phos 2 domain containing protein [Asbolus verrucosus]